VVFGLLKTGKFLASLHGCIHGAPENYPFLWQDKPKQRVIHMQRTLIFIFLCSLTFSSHAQGVITYGSNGVSVPSRIDQDSLEDSERYRRLKEYQQQLTNQKLQIELEKVQAERQQKQKALRQQRIEALSERCKALGSTGGTYDERVQCQTLQQHQNLDLSLPDETLGIPLE
jgi:hypothetical protein